MRKKGGYVQRVDAFVFDTRIAWYREKNVFKVCSNLTVIWHVMSKKGGEAQKWYCMLCWQRVLDNHVLIWSGSFFFSSGKAYFVSIVVFVVVFFFLQKIGDLTMVGSVSRGSSSDYQSKSGKQCVGWSNGKNAKVFIWDDWCAERNRQWKINSSCLDARGWRTTRDDVASTCGIVNEQFIHFVCLPIHGVVRRPTCGECNVISCFDGRRRSEITRSFDKKGGMLSQNTMHRDLPVTCGFLAMKTQSIISCILRSEAWDPKKGGATVTCACVWFEGSRTENCHDEQEQTAFRKEYYWQPPIVGRIFYPVKKQPSTTIMRRHDRSSFHEKFMMWVMDVGWLMVRRRWTVDHHFTRNSFLKVFSF